MTQMCGPTWARDYDRECTAWPKYLAAIANSGCEPQHREWLMYREGYAQGLRDAKTGEAEYPIDPLR